MGSPGEEGVSARVKSTVEKMVGGKAVAGGKHKGGIACFALVDQVLKSVGAKTAADFDEVTPTSDYVWGEAVELDAIQPGDILQFRDHAVTITTQKLGEFAWKVTSEEGPARRPHHTAVVVAVQEDGSVEVVEQNVRPDPKTIRRSIIARLAEGEETRRRSNLERIIIKVTGAVKAYRPVAKPKGAILLPRDEKRTLDGRRMLAQRWPSEGGHKRLSGPLGRA